MTKQPHGPENPLDWKYGEPGSDSVFDALEPLYLPPTYIETWHKRFHQWALRMNVTILALRRAEQDHSLHSRAVDEGIDRIRGFYSRACQDAFGFLLKTSAKEHAIYTAFCLEHELQDDPELVPEFKGELQPLWTEVRQLLSERLGKIDAIGAQLEFVQPLAAVLRELRTLVSGSATRGPIPNIELLCESADQRALVLIDGERVGVTLNAAWLLATCGITGFERECYRDTSVSELCAQLTGMGFSNAHSLITKRSQTDCRCSRHYGCYTMDNRLRARVVPAEGPNLIKVQDFLAAKRKSKLGREPVQRKK